MFMRRTAEAARCVVVLGLLSLLGVYAPASAKMSCGTEKARSSGQIFRVVTGGVACVTARSVAGRWFHQTSRGESGRVVVDRRQRRWTCRVTERATGTDPGLIPFTSVRCTSHSAVVRFKQRS